MDTAGRGAATGLMGPDAEAVFSDLFTQHAGAVFRFCGRRSGNWRLAEDLTSVVFLEAWKSRQRAFTVNGSLLPWLLGIAAKIVSTSRRSLHRYHAALQRFQSYGGADTDAGPDVADDAIRQADLDRTTRIVRAAMDRLPRPQRELAELCFMGELTAPQAAAVLGIAVSTARSRLDGARGQLRRLLRSAEIDQPSWLIGHEPGERHLSGARNGDPGELR
jgi:RNA polymerase sigma factor (sigma-70 family)